MNYPVIQRTSTFPPCPLRFSWHFLWAPCNRTGSVNLSAFFCSFSPCRRKARSLSGCASGPLGPLCCLFSSPPSWARCVCVCLPDLCFWAFAHADSLVFPESSLCACSMLVRAPADIPGAQCENVCASIVHIQCSMCVLILVFSLTPPDTDCLPLLLLLHSVHPFSTPCCCRLAYAINPCWAQHAYILCIWKQELLQTFCASYEGP